MAKATKIKVGGVWKDVKNIWIKRGGIWKAKVIPKIMVGGVWKECIGYYVPYAYIGIKDASGNTKVYKLDENLTIVDQRTIIGGNYVTALEVTMDDHVFLSVYSITNGTLLLDENLNTFTTFYGYNRATYPALLTRDDYWHNAILAADTSYDVFWNDSKGTLRVDDISNDVIRGMRYSKKTDRIYAHYSLGNADTRIGVVSNDSFYNSNKIAVNYKTYITNSTNRVTRMRVNHDGDLLYSYYNTAVVKHDGTGTYNPVVSVDARDGLAIMPNGDFLTLSDANSILRKYSASGVLLAQTPNYINGNWVAEDIIADRKGNIYVSAKAISINSGAYILKLNSSLQVVATRTLDSNQGAEPYFVGATGASYGAYPL
mgnify:CR=1 FL=1